MNFALSLYMHQLLSFFVICGSLSASLPAQMVSRLHKAAAYLPQTRSRTRTITYCIRNHCPTLPILCNAQRMNFACTPHWSLKKPVY